MHSTEGVACHAVLEASTGWAAGHHGRKLQSLQLQHFSGKGAELEAMFGETGERLADFEQKSQAT